MNWTGEKLRIFPESCVGRVTLLKYHTETWNMETYNPTKGLPD